MDEINMDGTYQQLKNEAPFPYTYKCGNCNQKVISEVQVSYIKEIDNRIKLFHPLHCPECSKDTIKDLMIKVIAEITEEGELHPKNKKGRIK